MMRAYVFVDAENHFLRSEAAAAKLLDNPRAAEALSKANLNIPGISGFPHRIEGNRYGWDKELQLFWDCDLLSRSGLLSTIDVRISRAIYVCSCTGNEEKIHNMRVRLRKYESEPLVIQEPKNLRDRRITSREQYQLIEKPKGCDISIASRMVADAAADLYDYCFLFTSDADFLPAIEAVRRMGKIVWGFGYLSEIQQRSAYRYVPDRFVDLNDYLRHTWVNFSISNSASS